LLHSQPTLGVDHPLQARLVLGENVAEGNEAIQDSLARA
jgi:hypothetical protein